MSVNEGDTISIATMPVQDFLQMMLGKIQDTGESCRLLLGYWLQSDNQAAIRGHLGTDSRRHQDSRTEEVELGGSMKGIQKDLSDVCTSKKSTVLS